MYLYQWLVFLHVVGVFGFLLAHGASAMVSFRLRGERDVNAIRALLYLSSSALMVAFYSLIVLLVGGVGAGFAGHWWSRGWIWTALGVFVVVWGLMSAFSGRTMRQARLAVGFTGPGRPMKEPGTPEQIAAALVATNPWQGLLTGGVGLLVILWLMMFKPF
ncbi:MAG: hypothetical protein ACXWP6_20115 [Ktedonobacterales bacterium]